MRTTVFSSCEQYLFSRPLDSIRERPPGDPQSYKSSSTSLEALLQKKDSSNEHVLLESINSTIDSLKCTKDTGFLEASAYTIMHDLLLLINAENEDLQASAYVCLQYLCEYADHDEVAYNMMNELVCVDCNYDNPLVSLQNARFSAVLLEMFGKSLERMTRARDWMLYLTLLANFFVTHIEAMVPNLIQDSSLGSPRPPSAWDSCCILYTNSCLDFVHFIHSKTVAKEPSTFPFNSTDIGKEDGDTKRRYLAYFLTNLILENVVANLDLQLSDTYFKMLNPVYASRIKIHRSSANAPVKSTDCAYKPMYAIVHRTMELSLKYGLSFNNMHQLQMSLYTHTDPNYSEEQRSRELDLQVINNRAYPLSFNGAAVLLSLSLYDKLIYSTITSKPSMGLYDDTIAIYNLTKQYFGIAMNLCLKCQDQICMADKGIFVLLFMSQGIDHVRVSMDMLDKQIPGPCAGQPAITSSSAIQLLTTVASVCPDSTIRFITYKLIEKFISLGDEQVQLFLFEELLQTCPYPSMNVAAIGLLKDHVCKVFEEKRFTSAFASPIILTEFVPIILKYKDVWETKQSEFWDDYSYIMQALVFYRTVCINDKQKLTALWDTVDTMNEIYFKPLSNLLDEIDTQHLDKEMQVETMKHQLGLIYSDILNHKDLQ
ncbi:Aldo_ket_red domain-containing protein [Mucor velutinosus]|uniref:Aldo_ket_red domain-containing protein n=1 Tax=Mucor velutinosus TaxID=708070 RepID=A0AAN7D643_9FUNG|nr:Aldo_ket_red domain-containing protein [Mucor velutinosus]